MGLPFTPMRATTLLPISWLVFFALVSAPAIAIVPFHKPITPLLKRLPNSQELGNPNMSASLNSLKGIGDYIGFLL